MSTLAFLTPDVRSADVLARSPMEHLARQAGGRFEPRDGWNVAAGFDSAEAEAERVTKTVGFTDRSELAKFELCGLAETIASLRLTLGTAEQRDGAWWCPITPERVLVFGEPGAAAGIRAAVDAVGGRVVDLTTGLCAMTLVGPGCRELLARFCAIDVRPKVAPARSFRPGSVARTPGYLLVEDEQRLLIMVGWALGQYLWEIVADAAEHLGGGPVGADAPVPTTPAGGSNA
jgi:glycine cleavage system aminomethyltransferase T